MKKMLTLIIVCVLSISPFVINVHADGVLEQQENGYGIQPAYHHLPEDTRPEPKGLCP